MQVLYLAGFAALSINIRPMSRRTVQRGSHYCPGILKRYDSIAERDSPDCLWVDPRNCHMKKVGDPHVEMKHRYFKNNAQ